jgi:hypothetical protein
VRPGNPLLDEHVWADWELAIEFSPADLKSDDKLLAG